MSVIVAACYHDCFCLMYVRIVCVCVFCCYVVVTFIQVCGAVLELFFNHY